jgi:hypothetical protein
MCRGEKHTTRQPIPWGMSLDMPHPCARRQSTDKSVTKGLPFAILPESPLGLVWSCHAFLGSAASLPTSSIPRSADQSRRLAVLALLVQPPRRGSTPLRPRCERLFHSHLQVVSRRRCIVHASVAPPPTTGAHVAPRQGLHHPHHGAGSACETLQPCANARTSCLSLLARSLP